MLGEYELVRDCHPPHVAVARGEGHLLLVARRELAPGQLLLTIAGVETDTPGQHSIQVSETGHVVRGEPELDDQGRDRYPWRFINHACEPNLCLRGRALVVLRAVEVGEELTLNYSASEFDMREPFECVCSGAGGCELTSPEADGRFLVRGFRHLSVVQRQAIDAYACPHVKSLGRADPSGRP